MGGAVSPPLEQKYYFDVLRVHLRYWEAVCMLILSLKLYIGGIVCGTVWYDSVLCRKKFEVKSWILGMLARSMKKNQG